MFIWNITYERKDIRRSSHHTYSSISMHIYFSIHKMIFKRVDLIFYPILCSNFRTFSCTIENIKATVFLWSKLLLYIVYIILINKTKHYFNTVGNIRINRLLRVFYVYSSLVCWERKHCYSSADLEWLWLYAWWTPHSTKKLNIIIINGYWVLF